MKFSRASMSSGKSQSSIGRRLRDLGFEVEFHPAEGLHEHTDEHPRINVIGRRRGRRSRPCLHLNGHVDVVPPGDGWTVDPFAGLVRDGALYGRGSADMKAGLASAIYAAEAVRRSGLELQGSLEISATVDEESGGLAGVAHLCKSGRVSSSNTDFVIIPEPFGVDRVCIGHRGVYWFKVSTRGRTAHGSMPFLGVNAIDGLSSLLEAMRRELIPGMNARRTQMPIVPPGAQRPTLNVNSIKGGQLESGAPSPCVPDSCAAIFDRRFLFEENLQAVKEEIRVLIEKVQEGSSLDYQLEDLMVAHPVVTSRESQLVASLEENVRLLLGRRPQIVASPGTYDHKHFRHIGGIQQCVAYGPGQLEQAHQPDEHCSIEELLTATRVLALAILDLTSTA
jgi:succinyl-diaminopimelate desuccinylase